MTLLGSVTLFLVLTAMAALPSSSVALVVARSAMSGVRHGISVAGGIVVGDLIFMSMAIFGMAAIASQLGTFFALIKYAAALYLIWFGIGLIRSQFMKARSAEKSSDQGIFQGRLGGSFAAGLLLTLGDIKAIFFYASLLPAFADLGALSAKDIAILTSITVLSVGSVKLVYALAAVRLVGWARGQRYRKHIKTVAGAFFVIAGGYLILKT